MIIPIKAIAPNGAVHQVPALLLKIGNKPVELCSANEIAEVSKLVVPLPEPEEPYYSITLKSK